MFGSQVKYYVPTADLLVRDYKLILEHHNIMNHLPSSSIAIHISLRPVRRIVDCESTY